VLRFSDFPWTPSRPKTTAGTATNKNLTVAYDFPFAGYSIGAMDSPFDFIYKLHEQRQVLRAHFSALPAAGNALFPSGLGGNLAQVLTNSQLAQWPTTLAPNDRWRFYWKEPEGVRRAYIPGLGLRYHDGTNANAEGESQPGVHLGFTNKASAGVDCIGFVQRTASYLDNKYKWGNCPTDLAEGRGNPDTAVRNTEYPVEAVSRFTLLSKDDYATSTLDSLRMALRMLIPGDIFTYGPNSHIGIISQIDHSAMMNATQKTDILKAIKIMESTYNGTICNVINTNSLDDIRTRDAWSLGRLVIEIE
jgi:hypothetical protein